MHPRLLAQTMRGLAPVPLPAVDASGRAALAAARGRERVVVTPTPSRRASGADRWLVSYADFMTLLLAFFMALYAVSDVDPAKLATAASSLRAAFDAPPVDDRPREPAARPVRRRRPAQRPRPRRAPDPRPTRWPQVREQIEKELAGAITAGQLEIGADDRGLVLSLPESATFPVASADVTADAQAVIDRVAATLEPLDVGGAHRRAHRRHADPHRALLLELGAVHRAGQRRGGALHRSARRSAPPVGGRLRRVPSARRRTPPPTAARRTGAWTSSSSRRRRRPATSRRRSRR